MPFGFVPSEIRFVISQVDVYDNCDETFFAGDRINLHAPSGLTATLSRFVPT